MWRLIAGRSAGRRFAAVSGLVLTVTVAGGCAESPPPSTVVATGRTTAATTAAPAGRTASTAAGTHGTQSSAAGRRGRWDHVVVVVEENHAAGEVVGNPDAPYLGALAGSGVSFAKYSALTHPSQPNYLALFSGSTQGVGDDSCPHTFAGPNLGFQLRRAGLSFTGYAEDLPGPGDPICSSGGYARKHAPWVNFADLPAAVGQPLRRFPADPNQLPTVALVIPNLQHDMHDGTVAQADAWLRQELAAYAAWAPMHRSLLLVTWDEDDASAGNHVPTVAIGAGVRTGIDRQPVTHYDLLRTLEDAYGLDHLGGAAAAAGLHALGG